MIKWGIHNQPFYLNVHLPSQGGGRWCLNPPPIAWRNVGCVLIIIIISAHKNLYHYYVISQIFFQCKQNWFQFVDGEVETGRAEDACSMLYKSASSYCSKMLEKTNLNWKMAHSFRVSIYGHLVLLIWFMERQEYSEGDCSLHGGQWAKQGKKERGWNPSMASNGYTFQWPTIFL